MGNCLAACNKRVDEGGQRLGKLGEKRALQLAVRHSVAAVPSQPDTPSIQSAEPPPQAPSNHIKADAVYSAVQKDLDDLQERLSHSQVLLSTLRCRYIGPDEKTVLLITRSTQTLAVIQEPITKEDLSIAEVDGDNEGTDITVVEEDILATKGVQTELCQLVYTSGSDIEYFIPPIPAISPDIEDEFGGDRLGQLIDPDTLDLDIHRSCRKLSVLPEEQIYDVGWTRQLSDPGGTPVTAGVRRQASDPSPRSTTRPLQLPSRGDSAISSAGSTTSSPLPPPPPPSTPPPFSSPILLPISSPLMPASPILSPSPIASPMLSASPIASPMLSPPASPMPTTSPVTPISPPASPPALPVVSSSDTSLSFFTPDDFPTDPTLSPPSLLSPTPMARVPSRRRLVRSLATDNASDSDSPQKLNQSCPDPGDFDDLNPKVLKAALEMETVARRPSSSSSGSQEHGLNSLLDQPNPFGDLPSSPEEIESVATSLAIAFKTDKLTLVRRLEIQTRLRDQSEINVANEIQAIKQLIQEVDPDVEGGTRSELARRLEEQVETLHRSARYVSSAAEMYGAVQYEKRLSQAMDVITKYVENLRQALEDERSSHEETRKLLKENKPLLSSVKSQNSNGKRRASIATLDQGHSSPEGRLSGSRKGSLIKRFGSCKSSSYSELSLGLRKVSDASAIVGSGVRITDSTVTELSGDEDGTPSLCTNDDCTCREDSTNLLGEDCEDGDDFDRPPAKTTFAEEDLSITRKHPMRYKFKKRGSFIAPRWFMKLAEEWGWVQGGRVADAVTQLRYAAAGLCLLAAFAVLSSSFFLSADL